MSHGGNVCSSQVIGFGTNKLHRNPVLGPYLNGHNKRVCETNGIVVNPQIVNNVEALGTRMPISVRHQESLVAFQTRLSHEEECRLKNSLKAQRVFQQALRLLETHRGSHAVALHGGHMTTPPTVAEHDALLPRAYGTVKGNEKEEEEGRKTAHKTEEETLTLREKLALRDSTIQRLQSELDKTRTMYEAKISSIQAAHMRVKQLAELEIDELKAQLSHVSPVGNPSHDAQVESSSFLEAIKFKERLLEEMHDAFQHALKEWKSGAMRTVEGLRETTEAEVCSIVGRAESLAQELQTVLSALTTSRNEAGVSVRADVVERALRDESALLTSCEAKLREQVRAVVKNAVRSRVKDILRPLVQHELQGRGESYVPQNRNSSDAVKSAVTGSLPSFVASSPSPAQVCCEEAITPFQKVASRHEQRMLSQRRDVSLGGAAATARPDGLSQCATAQRHESSSNGTGRPSWLNRYCY